MAWQRIGGCGRASPRIQQPLDRGGTTMAEFIVSNNSTLHIADMPLLTLQQQFELQEIWQKAGLLSAPHDADNATRAQLLREMQIHELAYRQEHGLLGG